MARIGLSRSRTGDDFIEPVTIDIRPRHIGSILEYVVITEEADAADGPCAFSGGIIIKVPAPDMGSENAARAGGCDDLIVTIAIQVRRGRFDTEFPRAVGDEVKTLNAGDGL